MGRHLSSPLGSVEDGAGADESRAGGHPIGCMVENTLGSPAREAGIVC